MKIAGWGKPGVLKLFWLSAKISRPIRNLTTGPWQGRGETGSFLGRRFLGSAKIDKNFYLKHQKTNSNSQNIQILLIFSLFLWSEFGDCLCVFLQGKFQWEFSSVIKKLFLANFSLAHSQILACYGPALRLSKCENTILNPLYVACLFDQIHITFS